jgi:hypothetical protein
MNVDAIVTALQGASTDFVNIDHAWTAEPLDDLNAETPALMLLPGPISAPPNRGDMHVSQMAQEQLHCDIVCEHNELDALRSQLLEQVLGMELTQHHSMMEYLSGNAQGVNGRYIWWRDIFVTEQLYRNNRN